jgi:hypothetical protein
MNTPQKHHQKFISIQFVEWVILAVLLMSCSNANPASVKQTGTQLPIQINPLLVGSYTTSISAGDAQKAGVAEDNAGKWELSLKDDGRYELSHAGVWAARGPYQVVGSKIRFQVQEICPICRCPADKGEYQWITTAQGLQLTEEDDPCSDLAMIFSAHPWKKK